MEFASYKDAYAYWKKNKDKVPDGQIMVISGDGHKVYTRPLQEIAIERSKRPKEGVFTGYGRDTLPGGVNGIVNHADGKRYDSKSQYERAVRAKGCRIVGNDWNNAQMKSTPEQRGIRGDFNVRPQLKEAVQKVLGT